MPVRGDSDLEDLDGRDVIVARDAPEVGTQEQSRAVDHDVGQSHREQEGIHHPARPGSGGVAVRRLASPTQPTKKEA